MPPAAATTTTSPSAGTTTTTAAPVDTAPTAAAVAGPRLGDEPTIIVNVGGVRAADGTVGPLPDGAVYTATAVGSPAASATCTTIGGTCILSVPPGRQWDVTETTPAPGYYLNPRFGSGTGEVVSPFPYAFRTGTLNGTTTVEVPGTDPNGLYTSNNQTFSGLMASSLANPPTASRCGLDIALVLDQSGSMLQGGKQDRLQSAANDAITAITGTPSTVAIYTFAATPGVSVETTSTIDAASAQPLHDFIDNLPTPAGGTNWDEALDQVESGFDAVVFVTDGVPSASRIRSNNFNLSLFTDTEQAIFSANAIKAGGTRIVGIGAGLAGGEDNLRAISGPTENQDYYLSSTTDFGDTLRGLAAGTCDNQLTITKQIQDSSGALIDPVPADANGWTFANTISGGSTIAPTATTGVVNGANGVAAAAVAVPADATPTLTVTETLEPGYTLVGAQCTVGGAEVATSVSGATATFTGAAALPMACTFTNRQLPPAPPEPTVTKTVTSNAQNADGTWTIVYDVAVTNPDELRPISAFRLTDMLDFGDNIDVNQAAVEGPGASTSWNGATDTTIVSGAPLAAGATVHYFVTVNATVQADATPDDRRCATGGGFLNRARVALSTTATAGAAPRALAAAACAEPASPTVTKRVASVVAGSTPGQWVVTYEVSAVNGTGTQVSYSLDDPLGFPAGVTVTSTSASWVHSALDGSAPTASEPVPGWTGTGSGTPLVSGQLLAAQSKDTYTIVVHATVTSGLAPDAAACAAAGPGHGYFNAAVLTSGSDRFDAQACAPITPLPGPAPSPTPPSSPSDPSTPTTSGTLPFTGLALKHEVLFGAALCAIGTALVLVSRRRRTRRGLSHGV